MKPLKVVAVCGMGMGTVFLIKMNLEKIFKELGIPAEVIASNISSLSLGADTDLIVASMDFEKVLKDKPIRKVFLRNLIDKEELKSKLLPVLKEMGYTTT
ncbi:PTS sugar transporter subunit IIB [Thermofilum sp.]|uniref:PTS sugar transporter subunit IIB n=1 Tax=Thermofilum sp. TaxID=1961369 RepID=UPI00316A6D65